MYFDPGSHADLLKLIAEHPLAWLVSRGAGRFEATPLPMLAETNPDGALVSLLGHCSRFNAQVDDRHIAVEQLILGLVALKIAQRPGHPGAAARDWRSRHAPRPFDGRRSTGCSAGESTAV